MTSQLATGPQATYPPLAGRFVGELPRNQQGNVAIDTGTWNVGTQTPTLPEHVSIRAHGYETDTQGRPMHPWAELMAGNPLLGTLFGKGELWNWGANQTADAITVSNGHVLMVQRLTGEWCFPGGFVDKGEIAAISGPRETREESRIIIPPYIVPTMLYHGPVADPRITANAWIETTLLLYELNDQAYLQEPVFDPTESLAAEWVPIEEVHNRELYGSHKQFFELAFGA